MIDERHGFAGARGASGGLGGPSRPPIQSIRPLTLGELLAAAAHRYPDKPAIIFKNTRITYAELRRRADAYLMIAHDLGVRLKDKYEVKKLDDDFFEEL